MFVEYLNAFGYFVAGGTVDVTVQKITSGGKLAHAHVASGGYWGGSLVNQKFSEFLANIFTDEVFVEFISSEMSDYLYLMRNFELKKREIQMSESRIVTLRIPASLQETFEAVHKDQNINQKIKSSFGEKVILKRDKLEIDNDIFREFFKPSVSNTIEHLKEVLRHPTCKEVSFMLLVGGFAESSIVNEEIRKEFPDLRIVIPMGSECGLAVLKGAVIFGHDPSIVESRVCPYTYGIAVHKPYIPGQHPESKSFRLDGKIRVEDCFEKLFTVGQEVPVGGKKSIVVHNTHYDDDRQSWRTEHKEIELFSSLDVNPQYVTDMGCKLHGTILVAPPGGQWPVVSEGEVEVEVGDTEMIVKYVDKHSKYVVTGTVDFFPKRGEEESDSSPVDMAAAQEAVLYRR